MQQITIDYERTSGSNGHPGIKRCYATIDSALGLFMRSKQKLPVGARIVLRFVMTNGYRLIAPAEVIFTGQRGSGVKFLALEAEDVEQLEAFVA